MTLLHYNAIQVRIMCRNEMEKKGLEAMIVSLVNFMDSNYEPLLSEAERINQLLDEIIRVKIHFGVSKQTDYAGKRCARDTFLILDTVKNEYN